MMCGTAKEEECVSMFLFMERACQVLSELSENLNRRAAAKRSHERLATNVTQVVSNFCYTKIMWCKYENVIEDPNIIYIAELQQSTANH